nr:roadblock/LC7 domain-containing protein [Umezawaea tangerina]
MPAVTDNALGWMLDQALQGVPHALDAILFSTDGLLIAHSAGLGRDDAEPLAAGLSASAALARQNSGTLADGPRGWRQSIDEYEGGYRLLMAAGPGAMLAATASTRVNLGELTYQLQKLVQRVGKELTSPPRQDTGSPS